MRAYSTKKQHIIVHIWILWLHVAQVRICAKTRQRHTLMLHVIGFDKRFLLDVIQQYESVKQPEAHVTMKAVEPCVLA